MPQQFVLNAYTLYTQQDGYDSCLYHGKADMPDGYYESDQLKNCVYKFVYNKDIPADRLCLSKGQFAVYDLIFGSRIECKPVNIDASKPPVESISILIKIAGPKKQITISESSLVKKIKRDKANLYINKDYVGALLFEQDTYCIHVMNCSNNGFITKDTTIGIISASDTVHIVTDNDMDTSPNRILMDINSFSQLGIGGLDNSLFEIFRKALSTRCIKPEVIKRLNIKHTKGLLLYGPPGCGKTLIARNIGKLLSTVPVKVVNGPELMDKFVGESEKKMRMIFEEAEKDYKANKENAKLHVIVFDEIDSICKTRSNSDSAGSRVNDGMLTQLLTKIDGVDELPNIFIIAMTNRKDMLDSALTRAGRIELHFCIGLPDREGRLQILKIHTQKLMENGAYSAELGGSLGYYADMTENFTGAELEALIRTATNYAIHDSVAEKSDNIVVNKSHMDDALSNMNPQFGSKYIASTTSPDNHIVYSHLSSLIREPKDSASYLIHGKRNKSKTLQLLYTNSFTIKYKKIVTPVDVMRFDEATKNDHLVNIYSGAILAGRGIIFLDEIDILMNYTRVMNTITYSSKIFLTIRTMLKKLHDKQIIVIATTDHPELFTEFDEVLDSDSNSIIPE
jgi:vesicle-fusing ATPase